LNAQSTARRAEGIDACNNETDPYTDVGYYGYMDVTGRVESGTETEGNAGAIAEGSYTPLPLCNRYVRND